MSKNKALIYPLFILLISLILYLFYQSEAENSVKDNLILSRDPNFDYLPTSTTGQIISHESFTLSYNEKYEQAEWVAYELKKEHLSNTNRKRPYFIQDQKVTTKSADYRNYKNSGYSRGHLCPAGDRKYSYEAFNETFLTSNISPQNFEFNAGIWNRLEQKVRYWVTNKKHLYVVTGGVLNKNLKTIGTEKVAIPTHFYKIILDYTEHEVKTIAFLIPNKESNRPLYEFVVSIDSIENLTFIDFFSDLPDNIESQLEVNSSYKNWSFK